jgi:transcription termination factor Rho
MTAEQQIERSVLEGKEREELHAIAHAMSLKTSSRSKKADIIDQILQATGVITPGAPGVTTAAGNGGGDRQEAAAAVLVEHANGHAGPGSYGDVATADPVVTLAGDVGALSEGAGTGNNVHTDAPVSHPDGIGSEPGPGSEALGLEDPQVTGAEGTNGSAGGGEPPATVALGSPAPSVSSPASSGANLSTTGSRQQGAQGNQSRHGSQPFGSQQGGVEVGNRRGRRRRGRERTPGDRELQGGNQESSYQGELVEVRGLLDLRDEGYGFLRCDGYLPSSKDVYISISQARRFALRKGDYIEGACRPASNNEKYPALLRIDTVSGLDPEVARLRPRFEDLTPLFPDSKLMLELPSDKDNLTARIVDLLSPIGKGQRGLIVSPPKAGKTTVMKQIAHSIEVNNPEVHLMVLLVDERPEEVTDMRRSVKGEVVASTFDRPSDEHTAVAELAIERAKRLVEKGSDVVIILDGITRLARAYNLAQPATGRIMSGGVDSGALYPPKKFFGAARNIEEGGSLTILATALVETGSKMDEVIFEEFKGTGNMELRLDRRLAERRLYPSIDVNASSTRHEELLFDRGQLQQVWKLRRVLNALANEGNAAAGLELLMDKIRTTKSNDEFLAEIAKGPAPNG